MFTDLSASCPKFSRDRSWRLNPKSDHQVHHPRFARIPEQYGKWFICCFLKVRSTRRQSSQSNSAHQIEEMYVLFFREHKTFGNILYLLKLSAKQPFPTHDSIFRALLWIMPAPRRPSQSGTAANSVMKMYLYLCIYRSIDLSIYLSIYLRARGSQVTTWISCAPVQTHEPPGRVSHSFTRVAPACPI